MTNVLTVLPWETTSGEALARRRPRSRVTCPVPETFISNADQGTAGPLS